MQVIFTKFTIGILGTVGLLFLISANDLVTASAFTHCFIVKLRLEMT